MNRQRDRFTCRQDWEVDEELVVARPRDHLLTVDLGRAVCRGRRRRGCAGSKRAAQGNRKVFSRNHGNRMRMGRKRRASAGRTEVPTAPSSGAGRYPIGGAREGVEPRGGGRAQSSSANATVDSRALNNTCSVSPERTAPARSRFRLVAGPGFGTTSSRWPVPPWSPPSCSSEWSAGPPCPWC